CFTPHSERHRSCRGEAARARSRMTARLRRTSGGGQQRLTLRTITKSPLPMLLPYLSETEWRSVAQVSELANDEDGKAGGISERRVVDMLKDLVELGKAELKEEPRHRTNPLKLYRKKPVVDHKRKAARDED